MQYVHFDSGQGPEGLTIKQCCAPQMQLDKVRVKVHAFGINRADTLQRQGKYPAPKGESDILGLEVAGEVIAVGEQVSQWKVGDKVCGLVAGGGYAQEVVVNPEHLMAIPENLTMPEAAGLTEVYLTAFQCLRFIADIQPQQRALIHAGASGVGLAALQLCRYFDVQTACTASSDDKLALCKEMGANIVINYRQQDFAEELKERWPHGVNMVLDMVAGDYLNRNLKVLALDGQIVYLAMLAGRYADKLDMALLLGKRARIQGSTLRNRSDEYKASLIRQFSSECLAGFNDKRLIVNIDTVLPVSGIQLAHARLESNSTKGKIVVIW